MRATFLQTRFFLIVPALIVIHKSCRAKNAVIPAGMQESSAMDDNLMVWHLPDLTALPKRTDCRPWTLDFGIRAEMTVLQPA
ncbi:MAG: hypothetical protein WCH01_09795 [Methylococcaceae bacterium]